MCHEIQKSHFNIKISNKKKPFVIFQLIQVFQFIHLQNDLF